VRVLLDTNVLVSAILFGGVPRQVLEAVLTGELDVVTSPALMSELEGILIRKFRFRSTAAASSRAEFETLAEVVEPIDVPRVMVDVADDEVLAAAVAGRAESIVTGDKELLELGRYKGIVIESPRSFIDRTGEEDQDG